jgi:hypothetical protein
MTLKYLPQWDTEEKKLMLQDINAVSFSSSGTWLACCNAKCVFILSAVSGDIAIRLWYPRKPKGMVWLRSKPSNAQLVCGYEDGSVVNIGFSDVGEVSLLAYY